MLTLKKGPNGTVDHFGECDALPGSPAFNLPYAFDHEAVAQILALTHGPEPFGVSPIARYGLTARTLPDREKFLGGVHRRSLRAGSERLHRKLQVLVEWEDRPQDIGVR